jgi:hypothetical protein
LETCTESLSRVQQFEPATLGREDDLGRQMSFVEAVPFAEAVIDVYKRIPVTALNDFTDGQLNAIQGQADSDFNVFKQILDFDATANNASNTRRQLITGLQSRRDQVFDQLWQFIAYGVARITDTSLLETQARATIQSIKDQSERLTKQLGDAKADADTALAAIRAVASEQGVSQQASYFKGEAESQETLAATWLDYTYKFAGAVAVFAVASLFLHKWAWLAPANTFEAIQLATSKILVFAVLAYMLIMSARNYTTHKHNAVVNRHRQNALLTYRALVEAAGESGTQDIVLAHAASCIFSPQDTGFSQQRGESLATSKSVLELLTKNTATRGSE